MLASAAKAKGGINARWSGFFTALLLHISMSLQCFENHLLLVCFVAPPMKMTTYGSELLLPGCGSLGPSPGARAQWWPDLCPWSPAGHSPKRHTTCRSVAECIGWCQRWWSDPQLKKLALGMSPL